ncbi:MAG: hypothetical protein IKX70_03850 [Treponema sp.]|nr:hypothetical protein [Treponema sp.]
MLKKRIAKACFFSFLFLVSIISCEIGLGGAVDTQPPTITIDSPKVDAVIRDVFAITGTWTDDGSITSVEAELKRTDGKGTPIRLEGTFETDKDKREKGTWKVLVDYQANNIIDGTYQATVYAKDNGKHETSQSTTFSVDNTPPILILSRPGTTITSNDFDSYGKKITLEGKATDDNNVGLIELSVYKEPDCLGEPLTTVGLKNVPLTVEQDVTEEGEEKYEAIYRENDTEDKDSKGTANRYFKIKVYDDAERIPLDSSDAREDDDKGNCADYYYTDEGLANALEKAGKITNLYHIQNGTLTTDDDEIIQGLENTVTTGKFSVNPKNNPTFIVNSRNAFNPSSTTYTDLDDPDFQVTSGNSYLEVEVTPGLDKKSINVSSVAVVLVECNKFGVYDEDNPQKIYLTNTGHTEAGSYPDVKITKSGTSYKFKTSKQIGKTNYTGLNTGHYYRVLVEGKDVSGNEIMCDDNYSFKLVASGDKIELGGHGEPDYISQNQESWTGNHAVFKIILNWNGGEPPYYIYRDNETTPITVTSQTNVNGENKWQAEEEFNYTKLSGLGFPETISYKMKKNGDVISTTTIINLNYDSVVQSISNVNLKTVGETKKDYYNETEDKYYVGNTADARFEISGIATDDTGIESVTLNIPGIPPVTIYNKSRFNFTNLDLSSLTSEVEAEIVATDLAGNKIPYLFTIVPDTSAPYSVDEIDSSSKNLEMRLGSTDNNDINPGDAIWDDNKDTDVGGKYGNGTFGNTKTLELRGDIKDDGSGLAKIYYMIDTEEHLIPEQEENEDEQTYETRVKEYLNNLKQTVISKKKVITPLVRPETKRVFYNVRKKEGNPDSAAIFPNSTQFTADANSKGYYKFYKEVESTFKDNITGLEEGNNYLILVAEDNVGNTEIISTDVLYNGEIQKFINYSINIDITAPSDITNKTASGIIFTNGSDMPLLWGTVSDKCESGAAAAGIDSLILSRDGEDTTLKADLLVINDASDEALSEFVEGLNITTAELAELKTAAGSDPTLVIWKKDITALLPSESKTVSISATAKDASGTGNETPSVIATVTIDKTAPTVTINAESPSDADADTNDCEINGTISIAGTSDDENGIDSVVGLYYKVYTETEPSVPAANTEIPETGNDGWYKVSASASGKTNWKITGINTAKLDGTNTIADNTKVCFTVAVKDKAGNIGYSAAKPVVINQDTDRPVINLSTLQLTYTDENSVVQKMDSTHPVWLNSSNFSGTITDDDGAIDYVKIIAKASTDNTAPTTTEWNNAANCYKNGIWTSPNFADNSIRIYIQVKEKGEGGKTFTSNIASTTAGTYGPKIIDVNSEKFGYTGDGNTADDLLYVKVDTQTPTLPSVLYFASDTLYTESQVTSAISDSDWKDAKILMRTDRFGGSKKYLYIKYKGFDANGVNSITPTLPSSTLKLTKEIPQTVDADKYKEYISCFDISTLESGLNKLEINIIDNATASSGQTGNSEFFDVTVDNTVPEISFSNYTSGSQVYGSSSVTLRGTTSDTNKVAKVEYALLTGNIPDDFDGWIEITDENAPTHTSALGWQIVFDDKTPQNNPTFTDPYSYHAELLKKALFTLYNVEGEEAQKNYDTTEKVYIWIRATDELGNSGINKTEQGGGGFFLDVIPNGDRPAVEITYPSSNTSVGGSIRITGTTDIQDVAASVSEVYIQIDPSYDSVAGFNPDWATELQTLMSAKGVTSYSIIDDPTATVGENTQSFADKIGKGIRSQGSSKLNWFLRINENKEFNSKVNESNRKMAIRAYAISSTGKVSVSELCIFEIDPEAPIFGGTEPLRFVQYEDANLTIESASRNFENGVYLKGQWYLVGSIEDDSGIRQITLDDTNIVWTEGSGDSEVVKTDGTNRAVPNTIYSSIAKFKNYTLKIPVGNTTANSFGKIEYEISATDGSESQTGNELKFTIYYDNKAPDFTMSKGNGKDLVENGKIYQSNGAYTVQGSFAEPSEGQNNQSGFERIAMFFTRVRTVNGAKGLYILDPMLASGSEGVANFIKVADINNAGEETCITNVEKKDGLYWRKTTGTLENTNELTIADTTLITNNTVRKGGICMVDNVIYRITRITGTKITLDGTLTDFSTAKPVYFAYAQIIDNLSQESGSTVVYTNNDVITNGDGDCMIEGVQFAGGEYNWNASLDSSNMLDGNVTMSFVAYDAAGNYTADSIAQKISNNAPRIAGVIFGTDTNLNGKVDDNELITSYETVFTGITNVRDGKVYNGQDENGELITSYEIPVSINVKGAVKVKPMIVGGNTTLGWQYTYINKSGVTQSTTTTQYNGVGHSYDGSVRTNDLKIDIYLKDFLEKQIKEGAQNLKFTIWDETDGSTLGDESTGSAKADIILPVNIIIADSVNPEAVVYPFFWKSKNENSVYQNNPKNGHIELESELPASFTPNGSGILDRDPKVSGMITFDGVASDNVIVDKIKIAIPGYNNGNEFIIAQRDATATDTDGWTSTNLYYKKGDEVKADASLTGDAAKPWVFELISDEYDDDGKNIITFRFHFNTENISSKALANASVKFTAVDKGSPALSNGVVGYSNARSSTPGNTSTTTASPTGCYKVDVVPYITRVKTVLSDLKKNNPSVYARSAKGNYSVSASEILNIEGFNVSGGTLKFEKTGGGTVTASYNANAGGEGVGGYVIPATAKSGKLVVTVGTIDSLNNSNNNEAKGSYAGTNTSATGDKSVYDNFYNRQPNGDNNNLLTDDVELDIWQFKDAGISQTSGYITEPIMKINPKNGLLNFGFNSGPANYCMGDGQTYSYKTWVGNYARFSTCGFTVDENGVTHGITVGLDTNPSSGSAGRMEYMTSAWGRSELNTNGNYQGKNASRFETIGAPGGTYNSVTFSSWVFLEDRLASPSIAAVVHGDDTYILLAYYDDLNGQIRFRYGNIADRNRDIDSYGMTFGGFIDQNQYKVPNANGTLTGNNFGDTGDGNHKSFDSNRKPEAFSIIASSSTTAKYSNYVSIDVVKGSTTADDIVVATWYDSLNEKWYYSYKKNPYTDNDMPTNPVAEPTSGNWRKPIELASKAGENCQIVVDKVGGIHIAAYDTVDANLIYAYLSSYDDATPQVVTVDSYAFTGTNIRLDTAVSDDGNYIIPYIGYYMSSIQKPKMAYLPGVVSSSTTKATREAVTISAGADESEAVTGLWETTVLPTSSRIADNYAYCYINIGLWKDESTGKAKIMSGTDVAYTNKSGIDKENTSTVYGNGTANPVLAYATRIGTRGHLETAQKK